MTDRANVLRDLVFVILQCADPALALAGDLQFQSQTTINAPIAMIALDKAALAMAKVAFAMANVVFAMATVALIRQGLAITAGEVVTILEHEALADDAFASHIQI